MNEGFSEEKAEDQDDEDDSASQNDEAEPTALPDASDDDHVRQDIFSPILSEADPTSRRPNDTPEPDASDDDHVSQDIFSPMLNEAEPNPTSRPDASEEEEQESPISEGAQSNKHEHTDHNDVDEAHCDTDQTGAGAVNSKALSARETNRTGAGSSRKRPAEDKDDEDDSASQNDEAEPTALPDASDDDHVRQDIFSPILSEADPTSRRPNDTPEPDASDDDHVSQDIFSPMLNEAEPNPTSRPDASEEEEQESPISEGAQSNKHEHTDHNDVDEAHCDTDQTGAGAVNSKALSARETNRTGAGSSRKRPAEDK
ncbi:hypothetical protein pipiens_015698, partial [Culex pipiens pipiens]